MSEDSQLNILHIASGDLWAGAEVQLFTLATALHSRPDTTVNVVLLNDGRLQQELQSAGINVIVLDESKLNGLQILRQLAQVIRGKRPDIVHTHRLKENILGSIAAFIAGKTASLRTAHGAPEHRPPWWKMPKRMLFLLERLCGRYLQRRIVAVSADLAALLGRDYPAGHIRVIENGIDLETLHRKHPAPASREGGKKTFKAGIAGRLVPVKRVDIFIQAAKDFMEACPDQQASFHIYGDGPLLDELEQLSRESGTGDIVNFEGHCDDLPEKLQQLDALLMTSDHEGLPMVLLEAMALGTPIIAHATGGIPQLLDHGRSGVLVQEHESAAYAREVCKFVKSPESRQEIARNALQRVTMHYSAKQNASAYHELYLEIAGVAEPGEHG